MAEEMNLTGFAIISDMTPEEMAAEIIAYQRDAMGRAHPDQLKLMLIQIRAAKYQKRMMDEAQFGDGEGPIQGIGFLSGGL